MTIDEAIAVLQKFKSNAPFMALTGDTQIFGELGGVQVADAANPDIAFAAVMILNYACGCEHQLYAEPFFDGVKKLSATSAPPADEVEAVAHALETTKDTSIQGFARAAISALSHRAARTEPPVPDGIAAEFEKIWTRFRDPKTNMGGDQLMNFAIDNGDAIASALRAAEQGAGK